jgi:hypothetical protein
MIWTTVFFLAIVVLWWRDRAQTRQAAAEAAAIRASYAEKSTEELLADYRRQNGPRLQLGRTGGFTVPSA